MKLSRREASWRKAPSGPAFRLCSLSAGRPVIDTEALWQMCQLVVMPIEAVHGHLWPCAFRYYSRR